jgi:hypothetical protein
MYLLVSYDFLVSCDYFLKRHEPSGLCNEEVYCVSKFMSLCICCLLHNILFFLYSLIYTTYLKFLTSYYASDIFHPFVGPFLGYMHTIF